jgi:hypothetical protein
MGGRAIWRKRPKLSPQLLTMLLVPSVIGWPIYGAIDPPRETERSAVSQAVREANFMAQPLMQAPDPWHGLMISQHGRNLHQQRDDRRSEIERSIAN